MLTIDGQMSLWLISKVRYNPCKTHNRIMILRCCIGPGMVRYRTIFRDHGIILFYLQFVCSWPRLPAASPSSLPSITAVPTQLAIALPAPTTPCFFMYLSAYIFLLQAEPPAMCPCCRCCSWHMRLDGKVLLLSSRSIDPSLDKHCVAKQTDCIDKHKIDS